MTVIIAGSRGITDYGAVCRAVQNSGFTITEVVSGGAKGVDKLGEKWAIDNNVPFTRMVPQWELYGPAAGPIRNGQMAKYAETKLPDAALIAVCPDPPTKGTADMIKQARGKGLRVHVELV